MSLFGASPSASSSKTSAPGRYSSAPSSSASSTTTRGGSTRPRYTCYLCPRSNRYPCARSHKGDSRIAPTGGEWSPTFVGMTDRGREGTGGNGGCDSPRGIEAPLRGAGCVKRSLPLAGSVGYSNRRLFCWRSLGRQAPRYQAAAARAERWRSLAERAALEMRCTFGYRGFESRPPPPAWCDYTERCWSLVEQARLESVCTFGYRGFKSHPLRHFSS